MSRSITPRRVLCAASATVLWAAPVAAAQPAGTVTKAEPLPQRLWVPEATAKAFRLTYATTNQRNQPDISTGELFIPKGTAPAGGWPVLSWAHGTSGLGDTCAPSVSGPSEPDRDFGYLKRWMQQGYAVVASDYTGLGTPGLPAYLGGRSEAHNVVDAVKAGRGYARANLDDADQLSDRWAALGQSQGGGAAIYTARYATEFGGPGLTYVGAVGTGVPADIEDVITALGGPGTPPVALSPGITAYLTYILTSLKDTRPDLGIDGILADTGRKYTELSKTRCIGTGFQDDVRGVSLGSYFTQRLDSLPGFRAAIDDYMAMPTTGFDKPFFMGHGLQDADVPYALTQPYVTSLQANRQPVTFKSYNADHSGALLQSQADTVPFMKALFAAAGPGPAIVPRPATAAAATTLKLVGRPRLGSAFRSGLRIRITAPGGSRRTVAAARGGRRAGRVRVTVPAAGSRTIRLRLNRAFRARYRTATRLPLRLTTSGATLRVTLRR